MGCEHAKPFGVIAAVGFLMFCESLNPGMG